MAIRSRAYQTLTSQCADLSAHKQGVVRFLVRMSQEPYGSRVVLGVWREDQHSALKSEDFQVDRETAVELFGLFHCPMELMVYSLWDCRTGILTGEVARESHVAYRKGARFYVYLSGPPTIHEDIYVVRLSRQPF